jgi:hypothetical protein
VKILNYIIICEEIASECLPYGCIVPVTGTMQPCLILDSFRPNIFAYLDTLHCRLWQVHCSVLSNSDVTVTQAPGLPPFSAAFFSRQPPTPVDSSFDFPDRLNTLKLMQRPSTFSHTNRVSQFSRLVSSPHAVHEHSDSHLS